MIDVRCAGARKALKRNVLPRLRAGFCAAVMATAMDTASAQTQPQPAPLTSQQYVEDFDERWATLRDGYAYFDSRRTDWNRVREIYRPQAAEVRSRTEFVGLLERVLEELHDSHTHLNTNTSRSTRLVPTGLDVWAEWRNGGAVVTQVRAGFSADQAGLKPGMSITAINGLAVGEAVEKRLGPVLRERDDVVRSWALRALLAGTRDVPRVVEAKTNGATAAFNLDLPEHQRVDQPAPRPRVEAQVLEDGYGVIRVNDLGSDETVAEFNRALEQLKKTRGLILDLRATQSGGNTSVAEPILGRLIAKRSAYQRGKPRSGKSWTREVSPRGPWRYSAPLVVLVGRWTASMGEGMAIGLDGMKRATVVGTPMAGLQGAVFTGQLKHSRIRFNYAAEKLFHLNGTPREKFVPEVVVDEANAHEAGMLAEALRVLKAKAQ